MTQRTDEFEVYKISSKRIYTEKIMVVSERSYTINLNQREVVSLLATPGQEKELAVGFLWSEGLIVSPQEIVAVDIGKDNTIEITTCSEKAEWQISDLKPTLTSGCGRGVMLSASGRRY